MYIAMNRFKVQNGSEEAFESVWKNRDSSLSEMAGFKEFHLLQGATTPEFTLFASHSVWESRQAFEDWTKSEAFRKAHAGAGASRDIYLGPPNLELFDAVI